MSKLKKMSLTELNEAKEECLKLINLYSSHEYGQRVRLQWIEKYIKDKTKVKDYVSQ